VSEPRAFLELGFRHITTLSALDHLLFLLVLVAPYRPRDWRRLVAVASAFTLGHSVTLALVVTDALRLPTALVEFLIPLTIIGAALDNLRQGAETRRGWLGPLLAAGFDLIHGAGFASFLREMFTGSVALPLFAFNLGIELGQLAVVTALLLLLSGLDRGLRLARPGTGPRSRVLLASAGAALWALAIAVQRTPW